MEQQTENNGNANVSMAPVYVAVFCTALAALALELVQTRVLSALFHNHVVSLTITIALLGFGISGVFVSLLSGESGFARQMGGDLYRTLLCHCDRLPPVRRLRTDTLSPERFPS